MRFFDIIKEVSESGTTVLLVEQNAKKALSIADRAMSLRPEGLHWKVRQVIFFMMNLFRKLILESKQEGILWRIL